MDTFLSFFLESKSLQWSTKDCAWMYLLCIVFKKISKFTFFSLSFFILRIYPIDADSNRVTG